MDDLIRLSAVERYILELLVNRREMFGLEMVNVSNGLLKRGTIYVMLNRMAEKGYVDSRLEGRAPQEGGMPRRLYRVTGLGEQVLRAWMLPGAVPA